MKNILIIILLFVSYLTFSQRMTFDDWKEESKHNKKLLPKYGGKKKNFVERKADDQFVKDIMKGFESEKEASEHMIELGTKYLNQGKLKAAMYRFNQAYLLDENNSNIYWGFGAIYMAFGEFDLSREQYENGLKLDSKNAKILMDYGTTY